MKILKMKITDALLSALTDESIDLIYDSNNEFIDSFIFLTNLSEN